jgi:hypothetical protein
VTKQRDQSNKIKKPKTAASIAWVNCFDEIAAVLIVERIKRISEESLLISRDVTNFYKTWAENGIKDATPKDMRRAALHYLGFETKMGTEPLSLQKHARHTSMSTTLKYCRRPEDDIKSQGDLDLDS